eukprot:scaffold125303_cov31-Tisochrysis_lutea.AAC.2
MCRLDLVPGAPTKSEGHEREKACRSRVLCSQSCENQTGTFSRSVSVEHLSCAHPLLECGERDHLGAGNADSSRLASPHIDCRLLARQVLGEPRERPRRRVRDAANAFDE